MSKTALDIISRATYGPAGFVQQRGKTSNLPDREAAVIGVLHRAVLYRPGA